MTCSTCGASSDEASSACPNCGEPAVDAGAQLGVRALGVRTKWLIVAMYAAIGVSVLNAVTFATQPAITAAEEQPLSSGEEVVSTVLLLFIVGLSVAAPIMWVIWQRNAHENLVAMGMRDLRFKPRWIVIWWVIPLAQLVIPFKTVSELWRRSTGSTENPPWLAAWWGLFVGWLLLSAMGSTLIDSTDPDAVERRSYALAVGAASHVVAGIIALRLIKQVLAGQQALAKDRH